MVVLGWILIIVGIYFGLSTFLAGPVGTFRPGRQMAPVTRGSKILGYGLAIVLVFGGLTAIGSTMP